MHTLLFLRLSLRTARLVVLDPWRVRGGTWVEGVLALTFSSPETVKTGLYRPVPSRIGNLLILLLFIYTPSAI